MTALRAMAGMVLLVGCAAGPTAQPQTTAQNINLTRLAAGQTPPVRPGVCWTSDTMPAVIETVTEHLQISPERRRGDGSIFRPAEFETKTAQRLVQDREVVWFRTPCTGEITVTFIASLQRALKARGRFYDAITGVYDRPTASAVRKLQAERGLDSPILSLDAAQDLGLAAQYTQNE